MFSRRSLFSNAAGVAAAPALIGGTPARAASSHALKLGLASYSMRKQPLDKVLELCKAAGIRYITVKDMHMPMKDSREALQAAGAKIAAAGVTITGGGVINMKPDAKKGQGIDASFEAEVRKAFEYAKNAGFPLIVAAPAIEALDVVEKLVKEFDLPVAIHNHGPEDKLYPTPREILTVIKKRDKRVGVCMDIGHTVRAGGDPAKMALECGERLFDLHVKDVKLEGKKTVEKDGKKEEIPNWVQRPVGRAGIDIPALFKALVKLKFKGHVALEYEIDADDPLGGIRESLGYMRGVAGAIGALEAA